MDDGLIVVDTTPLIALSAAGYIGALAHLYESIVVPLEVIEEIRADGPLAPGTQELSGIPNGRHRHRAFQRNTPRLHR